MSDVSKRVYVKTSVNLKMDLYKRVEQFRIENNLPDRTSVIEKALIFYLSAVTCHACGTINPAKGIKCAVCGAELNQSIYDWWLTELSGVARTQPEEFKEIFDMVEPKLEEIRQKREEGK